MSDVTDTFAPGWPGIPARWTSSAKTGVGTAVSRDSRVWFTLSHGILNEVYYPRIDHACTRDLGFIVTDGQGYFSEEKRDTRSETSQVAPGIPAYRVGNTALDGQYRIEKEVLTDPWRDVVLQRIRFVPLKGTLADFRLYVRHAEIEDGEQPWRQVRAGPRSSSIGVASSAIHVAVAPFACGLFGRHSGQRGLLPSVTSQRIAMRNCGVLPCAHAGRQPHGFPRSPCTAPQRAAL